MLKNGTQDVSFICLLYVVVMLTLIACSKSDEESLSAQGINPEGTWGITACTYVSRGSSQNFYADEIKSGEAVTDFFFMKDGKFKQTSNMAGSWAFRTDEGTWKVAGTKLVITLMLNGSLTDVDYTIEQKGDVLILTRTSPDGSLSIVNTFKKK